MEQKPTDSDITRRSFLTKSIFAVGGIITAAIAGIGGTYFSSPLWRKNDESWIDIGSAKDFARDMPTSVQFTVRKRDAWTTIESRSSAWIVTADQINFTAFDPRCTHLGCPYRWNAVKKEFICPCHTARFAIDGSILSGPPPRGLDQYSTKVVSGRLYILPGKAA